MSGCAPGRISQDREPKTDTCCNDKPPHTTVRVSSLKPRPSKSNPGQQELPLLPDITTIGYSPGVCLASFAGIYICQDKHGQLSRLGKRPVSFCRLNLQQYCPVYSAR